MPPLLKTTPPKWLIVVTAAFTLLLLVMAVAETTLWIHYFIDAGEFVSLFGLAFIFGAGIYLYRQSRLWASLPLTVPWLIYPIVTQGDQIIDNLSINPMRLVVHFILAILFAAPVAVLVLGAHHFLKPDGVVKRQGWTKVFPGLPQLAQGKTRDGICYLSLTLLLLEMWVANAYLGTLMIVTLIILGFGFLLSLSLIDDRWSSVFTAQRAERLALNGLIIGVALSLGLYLGFKNRPGAYQGSPSAFLDPSQKDALYQLARVQIPDGVPEGASASVQQTLAEYGDALKTLYQGYHILDRNYTYAFHNALFLRNTVLLPDFRKKGLEEIENARHMAASADQDFGRLHDANALHGPLGALLEEVHSYVAYNLARAGLLEQMSGNFERTEAGLQHAAHLYEGENKMLGSVLMKILDKHRRTLESPDVKAVAGTFVTDSLQVYRADANRVVGF